MKLLLKDLGPGDEFEYVKTKLEYRRGKFLVLNSKGSYLSPIIRENCTFVFSFTTNKICDHWSSSEVNLILKTGENNMENKMGHFEGWKFGVPVIVKGTSGYIKKELLVHEDQFTFTLNGNNSYSKQSYNYELIPHKYSAYSPRYPVCSNLNRTAFCNEFGQLTSFGTTSEKLQPYPIATLNIDGKIIELSAETTAELKNKLGI